MRQIAKPSPSLHSGEKGIELVGLGDGLCEGVAAALLVRAEWGAGFINDVHLVTAPPRSNVFELV